MTARLLRNGKDLIHLFVAVPIHFPCITGIAVCNMDKGSFFLSIHMIGNVISRTAFQVSNRQIEGFRKSVCSIRNYTPEQLVRLNVSSFFHSEKNFVSHIAFSLWCDHGGKTPEKMSVSVFSAPHRTAQKRYRFSYFSHVPSAVPGKSFHPAPKVRKVKFHIPPHPGGAKVPAALFPLPPGQGC